MVVRIDPYRLAYMAVPKAACSSVKATLAAIDPAQPASDPSTLSQKEVHTIYPTQRFRQHRWQPLHGYFRFTVINDPLKRLLSLYSNRVVGLRELYNCRKIKRGKVNLPPDPDPDYFFQNIDAYIGVSSSIKHHALPTAVYTGPRLNTYSKVYRTKDLGTLADDLSEQVGHEVKVPHFNSSAMSLTLKDLKPKTHSALGVRLKDEYEHLSGYFANPFQTNTMPKGREALARWLS